MSKMQIFVDSSCDFPSEYAHSIGLTLVPLTVSFGDKHFTDGVDITPEMFFNLLSQSTTVLPKTSQPSPEAFMSAFRGCAPDCEDIICVTCTSKASGTYNSASLAKRLLLDDPTFIPRIHLFDSLNASIAIGVIAATASTMASIGKTVGEIFHRLEEMRERMSLYFVCDTIEYIRRGGRIGNIKGMLGELLNIKPVLSFIGGLPIDVGKCRGIQQAKDRLVEMFMMKALNTHEVLVIHANSMERAKELSEDLQRLVKDIKIKIFEVGAVMGTYTGPGAIGLAFEEKFPRAIPKSRLL